MYVRTLPAGASAPARPARVADLVPLALLVLLASVAPTASAGPVGHVIHVSVDGLHPAAVTTLGPGLAPNFYRLRSEGAFTDNARTDAMIAATLPDHASQFTGRNAFGPGGHGWLFNDETFDPETLHTNQGAYVASVFDVVHDAGGSTALYANKSKFSVFERSWGVYGDSDLMLPVDNTSKLDTYFYDGDMLPLAAAFVADLGANDYDYAFLHLREPDTTGHAENWDLTPGSAYLAAVQSVDTILGDLLSLVEGDPELMGDTAIVLTTDHSGELGTPIHVLLPDLGITESGIIPFYVWGPGVAAGAELYALNAGTRLDPGAGIPPFSDPLQPVRNGDAANLALDLLGLGPVPGSNINDLQNLSVPEPSSFGLLAAGLLGLAGRVRRIS